MELHLRPQSDICQASGHVFHPGDRVVSTLIRDAAGEFARWDVLAEHEGATDPPGEVLCRWTRVFKPPPTEADPERELKMTAETLFFELIDGAEAAVDGGVDENARLKQFLALMLERKRVLKRRAQDQGRIRYEHMATKRMVEVAAGEMDAAFFLEMHAKLGMLLGVGDPAAETGEAQPEQ